MYTVYLSKDVEKFLDKLDHHIKIRMEERLKLLGITQRALIKKHLYTFQTFITLWGQIYEFIHQSVRINK